MKIPSILLLLLSAVTVLFIAFGCGPCKTKKGDLAITQNAPFEIENTYCQKWVAGIKGGGSGINLYVTIDNVSEGVQMKEFHFRGKITNVSSSKESLYIGYFKSEANDVIMDSDVVKESTNTPPVISPFELENSEAVLSYEFNNKTYYHKIYDIEEKEMLAYPSSNPNNKL